MIGVMIYVAYYSIGEGDPYRYLNGSDSWGNVCGRNNSPIVGVPLSGKDHTHRTFEFHMGFCNILTALNPLGYLMSKNKPAKICVEECPKTLIDCRDLVNASDYAIPQSYLDEHVCTMSYDLILPHTSLFNRCIPAQLLQVCLICLYQCNVLFQKLQLYDWLK